MKTIGLTGGIGSGKSTIACILRHLGFPVYIADTEASRLMNSHPAIREDIIIRFGAKVYSQHGLINKPILAEIIFNDPQALQAINQIVHPRVMEHFRQWSQQQNNTMVFFESAILFEARLNTCFDCIICVTAPESTRLQRVMKRDHITPEKVRERLQNQLDDSQKCGQADFVIQNDDGQMIVEQVLEIIKKIKMKN